MPLHLGEDTTMRETTKVAAALLLGLACVPAWADEVSAQDCFLPAFKASDADAVTACYAEDAVLWIPGQPMAKGREAIHAALAGFFAMVSIKDMTITPMGGSTVGDDATSWGTFVLVAVDRKSGAESTEVGRYVDVSRKIDGKWVYVVDHASDDPPPPAKPDDQQM
jgi:uncharacterized protein (TIGR02246 family)